MYSRDKLFSALQHEIERILIKKIMLPLLGLSVVESPSAVSRAISYCIIVAVCTNVIEVTPDTECREFISSGRRRLLVVLGIYLHEQCFLSASY